MDDDYDSDSDPETASFYAQLFFKALKANSPDGTSKATNWEYAGGDTGRHARYFAIKFAGTLTTPPPYNTECICTHDIVENCYLQCRLNRDLLLVVGNCCIKKFLPKELQGRTCAICGKPHRNRRDNFCNECRAKGPRPCADCGNWAVETFCEACKQLPHCAGCQARLEDENARYCGACRFDCPTCHEIGPKPDDKRTECERCWERTAEVPCRRCLGGVTISGYARRLVEQGLSPGITCTHCRKGEIWTVAFGKYYGKTYLKVVETDPSYCEWVKKKIVDRPFAQWLREQPVPAIDLWA